MGPVSWKFIFCLQIGSCSIVLWWLMETTSKSQRTPLYLIVFPRVIRSIKTTYWSQGASLLYCMGLRIFLGDNSGFCHLLTYNLVDWVQYRKLRPSYCWQLWRWLWLQYLYVWINKFSPGWLVLAVHYLGKTWNTDSW